MEVRSSNNSSKFPCGLSCELHLVLGLPKSNHYSHFNVQRPNCKHSTLNIEHKHTLSYNETFGLRRPQLCAAWSVHDQNCQTPWVMLSLSPFLLLVSVLFKVTSQELTTHMYGETGITSAAAEICALCCDVHEKEAVSAILIT